MAAVKAIGGQRRGSSSKKTNKQQQQTTTSAAITKGIIATGPATNGPVGYNYLLCPGNNSRVILAVLRRRPWFGCANKQENLLRHCVTEGAGGDLNEIVPPTFLVKGGKGREKFENYVKTAGVDKENCFGLVMPDYGVVGGGEEEEEEEEGEEGGEEEEEEGVEEGVEEGECSDGKEGKEEINSEDTSDKSSKDCDKNSKDSKDCEPGSIWIVKPAASTNRGVGIKVCHGYDDVIKTVTTPSKSKYNNKLTKKHGWIVQKYMEKPYLVHGRKFDLRVYVLFNVNKAKKGVDAYMHTEFYVRTSSVAYDVSKKSIKNSMMHLTNDAVQKKKKGEYGKFEAGNKLSAKELEQYFVEHS
ncbi:hypothetical protein TrRE_jg5694, partial [Triparma retinervis]